MSDKGYIGNDMITPLRKPPNEEMPDHIKNWNTSVNKIRYMIERAIANLKPGEYCTPITGGR